MRARLAFAAAFLLALWVSACASCQPAPDADGQLAGALFLPFDEWKSDELWCKQPKPNDCQDWRWLQPQGDGAVTLELRTDAGAGALEVSITDDAGHRLQTAQNDAGGSARLVFDPKLPRYYVLVIMGGASDPSQRFPYQLRASQMKVVKPPPPRFRPVEAMLLEVERHPDGSQTVAIGVGEDQGIKVGLRGRLREGGKTIAEIEIVEVYPDGSRARIDGAPTSRITPQTTAEIDVPVEGSGRP